MWRMNYGMQDLKLKDWLEGYCNSLRDYIWVGLDFSEGDKEANLECVIPKSGHDKILLTVDLGDEGKRRIKENAYIPGLSS